MTGRTSRAKGKRWELACRKALTAIGIPCRAPQPGEAGDDIVLLGKLDEDYDGLALWSGQDKWSVECKDQSRDALPAWVDQAAKQATGPFGDGWRIGIVWHKRRGKPDPMDGFITMRARDFWERVA